MIKGRGKVQLPAGPLEIHERSRLRSSAAFAACRFDASRFDVATRIVETRSAPHAPNPSTGVAAYQLVGRLRRSRLLVNRPVGRIV